MGGRIGGRGDMVYNKMLLRDNGDDKIRAMYKIPEISPPALGLIC